MSAGLSNINYNNCTCSFVPGWILKAQKMYFIFFLSLRALCGDDTMKEVPRLFFGTFSSSTTRNEYLGSKADFSQT